MVVLPTCSRIFKGSLMPGKPARPSSILLWSSQNLFVALGRKAVFSITAVKRMTLFKSNGLSAAAQAFAPHLQQYKDESEKVGFWFPRILVGIYPYIHRKTSTKIEASCITTTQKAEVPQSLQGLLPSPSDLRSHPLRTVQITLSLPCRRSLSRRARGASNVPSQH